MDSALLIGIRSRNITRGHQTKGERAVILLHIHNASSKQHTFLVGWLRWIQYIFKMRNGVRLYVLAAAVPFAACFVVRPARQTANKVPLSKRLDYSAPPLSAVLVNTTDVMYSNHDGLERRQTIEQILRRTPALSDESHHQVTSRSVSTTPKQSICILSNDVWQARFLLLGAAALYGTNFSIVKILDHSMPVGVSSTLRFGMAAMATLPWLVMPLEFLINEQATTKRHDGGASTRASITLGATMAGFEVGMWNSVGYVAQAIGLETMDASKSAFICSLAVVTVPILDFFVGKRMLPREIVGAVLALTGVALLEGFFSGGTLGSGDVASLLQPITFGVGFWRMEKAMHTYPDSAGRLTAAQLLAVFMASALYCATTPLLGTPWPDAQQMMEWLTDPAIMGALFWTGVVTTALTVYMETLALKTLSAAETTLLFSTEPLWGAACAALLVGEQFGLDAAMGAALILSGCVISNMSLKDWFRKESQTAIPKSNTADKLYSPESTSLVSTAFTTGSFLAALQDSEQLVETVTDSL